MNGEGRNGQGCTLLLLAFIQTPEVKMPEHHTFDTPSPSLPRDGVQKATIALFGAEGFEGELNVPVLVFREQAAAVFTADDSHMPAACFVAETSFDAEEEAESGTDWRLSGE
jgi:hypothetical protein